MKGILLVAGVGSRLYPTTSVLPKALLPVYDKPTIYYPLSDMIAAGITDILVICSPTNLHFFKAQLGSGSRFGIDIRYAIQASPKGIADAFIVGEKFIGNDDVCLMFGDNVFHGGDFHKILRNKVAEFNGGAQAFALSVSDPQNFGVVELNEEGEVVLLEEKPQQPTTDKAVLGLYLCDAGVVDIAKGLTPSARGELEILDVLKAYQAVGNLAITVFDETLEWIDTGMPDSLLRASEYISEWQPMEMLIGSPELTAYKQGLITRERLAEYGDAMRKTNYGDMLTTAAKMKDAR